MSHQTALRLQATEQRLQDFEAALEGRPLDELSDDDLADIADQALELQENWGRAVFEHSQHKALQALRSVLVACSADSSSLAGDDCQHVRPRAR